MGICAKLIKRCRNGTNELKSGRNQPQSVLELLLLRLQPTRTLELDEEAANRTPRIEIAHERSIDGELDEGARARAAFHGQARLEIGNEHGLLRERQTVDAPGDGASLAVRKLDLARKAHFREAFFRE